MSDETAIALLALFAAGVVLLAWLLPGLAQG